MHKISKIANLVVEDSFFLVVAAKETIEEK